jgi:hypothetical protein
VNKINSSVSSPKPQPGHQQFIDWMKAAGMFIIVFGHVVGEPFNQFTVPVYPKQLGVAFFIFIMGWSLANERRPALKATFYRLFPVYLWGVSAAVILSGIMLVVKNDLNLSNYMPFVLGVNVFFDFFPANPTTWYIGTYIQIVLLWLVVFRRVRVGVPVLAFSLAVEVACRAVLMCIDKFYIAYMVVPNWITLFLLGMYLRHKQDVRRAGKIAPLFGIWAFVVILWALGWRNMNFDNAIPLRLFSQFSFPVNRIMISFCVSFVYLFNTYIFFEIFRRVRSGAMVAFFSRNTLIIFIWHMPLLYNLHPWLYSVLPYTWLKKSVIIAIMYIGLGAVSELITSIVKPRVLRDKIWIHYGQRVSAMLGLTGLAGIPRQGTTTIE